MLLKLFMPPKLQIWVFNGSQICVFEFLPIAIPNSSSMLQAVHWPVFVANRSPKSSLIALRIVSNIPSQSPCIASKCSGISRLSIFGCHGHKYLLHTGIINYIDCELRCVHLSVMHNSPLFSYIHTYVHTYL